MIAPTLSPQAALDKQAASHLISYKSRNQLQEAPAQKIYCLGLPTFPPADYLANALRDFAKEYTWIAGVSNMRSKDMLARLAGKLDCAMVTDVLSIESDDTFTRPIVAGAIIATVQVHATPVVMTFRTSGFKAQPTDKASEVVEHTFNWQGVTKRLSENSRGGGRPDLAQAKVVVSGGRPFKDAETFEKVIGGLADKLGGAVGATRAAVDSGIAANELQVGQTGKNRCPRPLYCRGDFWFHPAHGRNQRFQSHRCDQHRSRCPHL
ncbi:MAG: FAD-binding protein [Fimbriimonadaceae bacterium]